MSQKRIAIEYKPKRFGPKAVSDRWGDVVELVS